MTSVSAASTMIGLMGLDPVAYVPSALHRAGRIYPETNCYVDIWIELLHAFGVDPASAMAFTCTVDFEGDQWTFIKPPPDELRRLYGIDVHEMQLYRPVVAHLVEQLALGRTLIIEADSFYLPDTAATSYRRSHVKSSIAVEAIDPGRERLRYFHGLGYYEVSGEDYRGLLRLGGTYSEYGLPPYVELVRFDAGPRLDGHDLRRAAHEMLQANLARRPKRNPWLAYAERLTQDLPALLAGSADDYHAYAFATVRQCGAAFELTESFLEWIDDPSPHAAAARQSFGQQAAGAKTLLFKLARRRLFDPAPEIKQLAQDWDTGMAALEYMSRSSGSKD